MTNDLIHHSIEAIQDSSVAYVILVVTKEGEFVYSGYCPNELRELILNRIQKIDI